MHKKINYYKFVIAVHHTLFTVSEQNYARDYFNVGRAPPSEYVRQ